MSATLDQENRVAARSRSTEARSTQTQLPPSTRRRIIAEERSARRQRLTRLVAEATPTATPIVIDHDASNRMGRVFNFLLCAAAAMTMLGVIVQATSEQTIGSTLQGTGVDSPAPTLFVQTD